MTLKAKKPEVIVPSKPKFMIYGKAGTGKTYFSLEFPYPYFIDTERGSTRKPYVDKLIASGGAYLGPDEGSQDFIEVINQVRELATTQHPYKTLILDSFSKLYNLEQAAAEERVGSDFGKDKREANKPTRQLMRWLERLPMTVVLVCHQKNQWERRERELIMAGSTFDGLDKMAYDLDLLLEAKINGSKRYATVVKSRIEGFPVQMDIELDYPTFANLYGKAVIESPTQALTLADPAQVERIKYIVDLLKVPVEDSDKWLAKCQANQWEDLTAEQATKLLTFLEARLKGAK